MTKDAMVPINLRVPQSMLDSLDQTAALLNRDRSDCIRTAIANFLDLRPQSVEQRLAEAERRLDALDGGT